MISGVVTWAAVAGVLAREEVIRGVDDDEDNASGIDVERVACEERPAPRKNVECGVVEEDASIAVAVALEPMNTMQPSPRVPTRKPNNTSNDRELRKAFILV